MFDLNLVLHLVVPLTVFAGGRVCELTRKEEEEKGARRNSVLHYRGLQLCQAFPVLLTGNE